MVKSLKADPPRGANKATANIGGGAAEAWRGAGTEDEAGLGGHGEAEGLTGDWERGAGGGRGRGMEQRGCVCCVDPMTQYVDPMTQYAFLNHLSPGGP